MWECAAEIATCRRKVQWDFTFAREIAIVY
jgi:hypothetical protein